MLGVPWGRWQPRGQVWVLLPQLEHLWLLGLKGPGPLLCFIGLASAGLASA